MVRPHQTSEQESHVSISRHFKITAVCAALVCAGAATIPAHAAPIDGALAFGGGGGHSLVCSGSPCNSGNWTGIQFGTVNSITDAIGFFSFLLPGGTISMTNVNFATSGDVFTASNGGQSVTFTFTAPASGAIGIGADVLLSGIMTTTMAGYDPTPFQFAYSSQGNFRSWSAESVPLPGTVALLGLGLVGLATLRRRAA